MGLAERKAVAAIKETEFKDFMSNLQAVCGFEVKVEVDWNVIEAHKDGVWIGERKKCTEFLFGRVIEVFTKVCADAMGKDAVKDAVKGIHLIPSSGSPEFKDGILTVRNDVVGNGSHSVDQIKAVLEKGL
jgi:hypothetical protein